MVAGGLFTSRLRSHARGIQEATKCEIIEMICDGAKTGIKTFEQPTSSMVYSDNV